MQVVLLTLGMRSYHARLQACTAKLSECDQRGSLEYQTGIDIHENCCKQCIKKYANALLLNPMSTNCKQCAQMRVKREKLMSEVDKAFIDGTMLLNLVINDNTGGKNDNMDGENDN